MSTNNPYRPPKADLHMPKRAEAAAPVVPAEKIGGWLYLIGFGLVVSPFRIAYLLASIYVPLFTEGTWAQVTTPGSAAYHPFWAPLLVFEAVGNVGKLVLGLVALTHFLKRSRRTVPVIIAWYAWTAIYSLIDFFAADMIPHVAASSDPDTLRDLARSIIAAAIWIPYFLVSKRVKATFVR